MTRLAAAALRAPAAWVAVDAPRGAPAGTRILGGVGLDDRAPDAAGGAELAVALPLGDGVPAARLVVRGGAGRAWTAADADLLATVAESGARELALRREVDARRASEVLLAGILHVAADAIVSIDAAQRIRLFNAAAEHVFGYAADEVLGAPLAVLLPERVRAGHGAHVARFVESGASARWMSERGRIVGRRRDGTTFPAEATISRFGDGDAAVCTVVLRDVSERRRAEQALADARRELESILVSAAEGIIGLDEGGHATFVNPAASRMLGYDVGEIVGRYLHDLVHHTRPDGTPYPVAECPTFAAMHTRAACAVDRDVFWRRDGTSFPVEYTSTPLLDGDVLRGAVVTFSDITERRAAEEALRALALRDDLTGLHNRRGFTALAEQQLALARRTGEGCLLVFADLDGFKTTNDTFGHAVGDAALVEVAGILRDTFRQSDIVARLGGDEFVALAVHSRDETAASIVARLERRLAAANAQPGRRYALSLSVGAAHFTPDDERSLDALLAEADAALYASKRARAAARVVV